MPSVWIFHNCNGTRIRRKFVSLFIRIMTLKTLKATARRTFRTDSEKTGEKWPTSSAELSLRTSDARGSRLLNKITLNKSQGTMRFIHFFSLRLFGGAETIFTFFTHESLRTHYPPFAALPFAQLTNSATLSSNNSMLLPLKRTKILQ